MGQNNVLLIGALARDPELRYTPSGTAVFEGTLAGEERITKNDGTTTSIPWYHRFSLLGKSAEYAAEQNHKAGHILRISGQIDYSEWTDTNSGKNRSAIKIKVTPGVGIQRLEDRDDALVNDAGGGVRLSNDGGAFNQVMLSGNLTRDAELRHTKSGDAVTSLRLAINEKWRDRNGAENNKTHYIQIELWREAATAAQNHKKGQGLFVLGRLENTSFTNKDGDKVSATQVSPQICEVAVRTGEGGARPAQASQTRASAPAPSRSAAPSRAAPPSRPVRSGGLDIDQGLDDFPPEEEDLPF